MIRKSVLAVAVFAVALLAFPALAGAHVEIEPDGKLAADGTMKATLHVPNECEGSSTTSVALNFPTTPEVTTVDVAPVTGWTFADTTDPQSNAVTKLTLTGSLSGGDEQAFALTLAPIPASTDSLSFTALQNCANGDVIRWVEPTPPGGAEPEHPAPVLEIKSSSAASSTTTTAPAAKKSDSSSSTGVILGVVGAVVVIGGGALILLRRKR
jgi:uncharacterized protein YcnI